MQEGVKYPRFERDAKTIINDLVEHITKERGVYSSSIEPNPNEHKVWFNTNNNTLNIYENGRWNTISGQGGGSGSIPSFLSGIYSISMIDGTISGIKSLAINSSGYIYATGATIKGGTISGATISGGYINNAYISANGASMGSIIITNGNIGGNILLTGIISGGTISGATISGGNINGATLGGINVTSGSINFANISNAYIKDSTLTGTINATNATISGATISDATIKEGGNLNYGNGVLVTYTGSTSNPMLIPYEGAIGYSNKSIKISNVTISGSNIEANRINFISGDNQCMVYPLGSYLTVSRPLADMTLSHSIDLNNGSIAGLTSIKTLSYTGLTIEPYDVTGTGTPIIINGRAAGINIMANSTAHLNIEGITKLNWKQGSSNGYMMTFNTNNNTINSNYDTFNIANGTISGNANINLTLSGTISGGTISGATISGGNINGATLGGINVTSGSINYAYMNSATINGGFITGNTTINGATISGATISGGDIYGASIGNVTINTGSALLYAGSKILVTYTGSVANPILMPNGGNIGYPTASLNLCGVTLTGGDFTKLKNLQ